MKPYANPKQVQQRGRPSTKRKQKDPHQQKSNGHFNPVSATVNKDVMMLLEGERRARGKIVKILRNDRVVVKCISVRQGYNMRIPLNNDQKVLEPDEKYVFDLTSLAFITPFRAFSLKLFASQSEKIYTVDPQFYSSKPFIGILLFPIQIFLLKLLRISFLRTVEKNVWYYTLSYTCSQQKETIASD